MGTRSIIVARRMVDVVQGHAIDHVAIHLSGDRIESVVSGKVAHTPTEGETVIDLGDSTLLPGLIDSHVHFGIDVGDVEAQCRESVEYLALRSARTAVATLRAGITTGRNLGEKGAIGYALRRAVADGTIVGPRIVTAGQILVRPGGHVWFLGRQARGVDALRRAVREEISAGADLIKLVITGGVVTTGSDLVAAEFSSEEVAAVIDEAQGLGRFVAAHGHGGPAISVAVKAGVRSIEHGLLLTNADVDLMCERGTYLVSTAGVYQRIAELPETTPAQRRLIRHGLEQFRTILDYGRRRGLRIAVGTDENHSQLVTEMHFLVSAGFSRAEAIACATSSAAALLDMSHDLGSIEAGKYADLIAVSGNPLDDLAVLDDVRWVMQGGRPIALD